MFAVAPFNFTAIAGNLPTAPALMGNTVVFKPASTAVYAAHFLMKLYEEAGLPPGVINMVLGSGREIGDPVLAHPDLAGIHFTGSTAVFQGMWRTVGRQHRPLPHATRASSARPAARTSSSPTPPPTRPRSRPRSSAAASSTRARSARPRRASTRRRTCGRRCATRWPSRCPTIKMGDVRDFRNFMGAVIDKPSFETQKRGGRAGDRGGGRRGASSAARPTTREGWFVSPTVSRRPIPAST